MLELDQVWSKLLADASSTASQAGRADVVEYLKLRASKDKIRASGVDWLLAATIESAYSPDYLQHKLKVEREEPHSFREGNSNMVGVRLDVQYGVRCFSVEAGWVRTPADGIMRGGALAAARLSHFGIPANTINLRLVHTEALLHWLDDSGRDCDAEGIKRQIELLVAD